MNNRFCRCCFSDHNADDTICWRLLSLPSDSKAGRAHKGHQNTKLYPLVSNLPSLLQNNPKDRSKRRIHEQIQCKTKHLTYRRGFQAGLGLLCPPK